jgi:hypothetical protein
VPGAVKLDPHEVGRHGRLITADRSVKDFCRWVERATMDEHPDAKILPEMTNRMKDGHSRPPPTSWQRYAESLGDVEITTDMHDVVANDEHAVQLMNVIARRSSKTLVYRTAEIYPMKDGTITARWAFSRRPGPHRGLLRWLIRRHG